MAIYYSSIQNEYSSAWMMLKDRLDKVAGGTSVDGKVKMLDGELWASPTFRKGKTRTHLN